MRNKKERKRQRKKEEEEEKKIKDNVAWVKRSDCLRVSAAPQALRKL